MDHLSHPFGPVYDENSEVLILGSFPSPKSRDQGFYYGHPNNRFWNVLAAVLNEPIAETCGEKRAQLLRNHLALWDVISSCEIVGASDSSIKNVKPNNLKEIIEQSSIKRVFCNGAKSYELYGKTQEAQIGIVAEKMPSTSPANAAWSRKQLIEAYQVINEARTPYIPPVLTPEEVQALEKTINEYGTSLYELMNRAGKALAYEVKKLRDKAMQNGKKESTVTILCGSGNNGGDGWVCARILANQGIKVNLLSKIVPEAIKAEPARTAAIASVDTIRKGKARAFINPNEQAVSSALSKSTIVVDAILGTGFNHAAIKEPYGFWITEANKAKEAGAYLVSADIPSGLSAKTGKAVEKTIKADLTVTMLTSKAGLETPESKVYAGKTIIAPLDYIEPYLMTKESMKDDTKVP